MLTKIEQYLRQIYPDIKPETIDSVPAERRSQYDRDFATISDNYEEFSQYFASDKSVGVALYNVKLAKYMDKLFPGYKQMSEARQKECKSRSGLANLSITKVDIIYQKLTNPEDPMYQPGLSEKDAVSIASIYAKAYKKSTDLIAYKTGNILHDPDDWFKPIDEILYYPPNEQEQLSTLKDFVAKHNKKNIFNIKNILTGTKKHHITFENALEARDSIEKALSPSQSLEENEVGKEM